MKNKNDRQTKHYDSLKEKNHNYNYLSHIDTMMVGYDQILLLYIHKRAPDLIFRCKMCDLRATYYKL